MSALRGIKVVYGVEGDPVGLWCSEPLSGTAGEFLSILEKGPDSVSGAKGMVVLARRYGQGRPGWFILTLTVRKTHSRILYARDFATILSEAKPTS